MLHQLTRFCALCMFATFLALPSALSAQATSLLPAHWQNSPADFPTVDPDYIYNQLFYMVTHYQRREAGYDKNLPVNVNGHDEFAAYWTQEMGSDLQGFGPQVRRDPFPTPGWQGRPATVPAFNVEVSIPGVIHPEQEVIIGCHYDGEAISTQSAFDDASGCAIELGVAKAIASYWHSHNLYPARTLRFVIFDAEEQGLYGSFHYVNSTVNGDLQNIVAMFNEEQNGIAYPLRYLGKASNPLLPFYAFMTPLQNSQIYPNSTLSPQQKANISNFRTLIQQAVPAAFAQFRTMGYQELTYHSSNNQDIPQPIFTGDQIKNVQMGDDTIGSSDQMAFTMAGLPCVTMSGNFDTGPNGKPTPEHPGYPFDTSVDTIQLMNTFADGSSQQSQALTLALALPGMITTWMLNQPAILGSASADANPIAAISDIGQTQIGQSIALDAKASLDPNGSNNRLSYAWQFGDGTTASGVSITHTYKTAGTYTLTLTVSSPTGKRTISKTINVVTQSPGYDNPLTGFHPTGNIQLDPSYVLPKPNGSLTDTVLPKSLLPTSTKTSMTGTTTLPAPSTSTSLPIFLFIGIAILLVLVVAIAFVFVERRKEK